MNLKIKSDLFDFFLKKIGYQSIPVSQRVVLMMNLLTVVSWSCFVCVQPDIMRMVEEALTDLAEAKSNVSEERDDLNELVQDIQVLD